jgi:hypothetical protein
MRYDHSSVKILYRDSVGGGDYSYLFAIKKGQNPEPCFCITKICSNDSRTRVGRVIVPGKDLQAFHEVYYRSTRHFDPLPKAYRIEELRERYPNAFEAWTHADDEVLATMFNSGAGIGKLSTVLQRQTGAILFRLLNLGLIPA